MSFHLLIQNLVITGSLITIIPLVIAFLCLQKYWQSGTVTVLGTDITSLSETKLRPIRQKIGMIFHLARFLPPVVPAACCLVVACLVPYWGRSQRSW